VVESFDPFQGAKRSYVKVLAFLYVLGVTSCSLTPEAAKRRAFDEGNRFFDQRKYADAAISYRKAIQKDPRFGEAFLRLGLTEWRLKDSMAAYQDLTRATELMPDSMEAKIQLAEFCLTLYLGDPKRPALLYGKLGSLAGELLKSKAHRYSAFRIKGYLAMTDSKPEEAIVFLRKANEEKPNQPDIVTVLVENLLLTDNKKEAESLAQAFIAGNKSYGPIYNILYGHYLNTRRPAEAEGILQLKVSNNPKEMPYAIELCEHYWRSGKQQQAQEILNQRFANPQDFPLAHLEAGDFYTRLRNGDEAIRQYEAGMQSSPKEHLVYGKRIASALLSQSKTEEAAKRLDDVLKSFPNDEEATASRAALRLASGKPEEVDRAIGTFQSLTDAHPAKSDYAVRLASAYRLKGDNQAARKQLLALIQKDKTYVPALQALAEISIGEQQMEDATRWSDEVLALDPSNTSARLVRSATLALSGRDAEARSIVTALLRENPDLREANIQMALLHIRQKKYGQAEEILRKHYQPGQGEFRSLKGLAQIYSAQKQTDRAVAMIQDELRKFPDSIEARTLLAESAAEAGKYDLAFEQYQALIVKRPSSVKFVLALAALHQTKAAWDPAIANLEKAASLAPTDPQIQAILGRTLDQAGRSKDAIAAYRRSLSLLPNNPAVMNNLAYVLGETGGNLEEALDLAKNALQKSGDNPAIADTVGWIYLKKKDYPSAVQTFRGVVSRVPEDAAYRLHLAMALLATGERATARKELQFALQRNPSSADQAEIKKLLSAN